MMLISVSSIEGSMSFARLRISLKSDDLAHRGKVARRRLQVRIDARESGVLRCHRDVGGADVAPLAGVALPALRVAAAKLRLRLHAETGPRQPRGFAMLSDDLQR